MEMLHTIHINSDKKSVVLCDDGIFSGDTLKETIERFRNIGIIIDEIRVILNFSRKSDFDGIPIKAMYNPKDCIDWIDERDFFYGTPMSGASVKSTNFIYGVPYIANIAIAEKKASIPSNSSKIFREKMMDENKFLREKIDQARGSQTIL
jgi:hypothetical protein